MGTHIENKPGKVDNILFALVVGALVLLFVAMCQPIWRGEEMVAELKERCALAEGKVYERKSWLGGTVYECIERHS